MDADFGRRTPRVGGYRLLHRLGGGGFGEVYYAEHESSGAAAVKLMHPELIRSSKALEYRTRFRREVEFLAQLDHPAVPRLLDAGPDASRPWMATAYVAGPTLSGLVQTHGSLSSGAVRALAVRVAEVLDLLHGKGRAHRDLTPGNVLITPSGPHIIDFGLARAVGAEPMTRVGDVVGTLLYLPPERPSPGNGTRYDAAGDVFGLGGIALFAATGHPPYKNFGDLREGRIDFGGLPGDLAPVLRRLLDTDPDVRLSAAAAKLMLRTVDTRSRLSDFADALAPAHRRALRDHPSRPTPTDERPSPTVGHQMATEYGSADASGVSTGGVFTSAISAGGAATQDVAVPANRPLNPLGVVGPGLLVADIDPSRVRVPARRDGERDRRPPLGRARPKPPVRKTPVETLWDRALTDWVHHVVATPDGTVLVATADGVLTAMDGHTGHFRWDERLPGGLHGTPVADGRLVHAGSADGWLNTFDTAARTMTDRRRVGGRVIGCAVAPGRVVVAAGSGVVSSFPSAHGAAEWREPVGAPITAPPVVAGRVVYVADACGRLHALDLEDGAGVWPNPPELHERPTTLAVSGSLVVAAGADGGVHAFDARDGSPRWRKRSAAQVWACLADPASGTVYTGALDGVVRGYDAATGSVTYDSKVNGGIRRSLTEIDGLLVVGDTGGDTVVLDPEDGHPVWRHTGGVPVHAPAAVVPDGPVVVGRLDGRVCALPPP